MHEYASKLRFPRNPDVAIIKITSQELFPSGAVAMSKSLEERIAKVEQEIERLKDKSNGPKDKSRWISDISGSFKNDDDFDEILRLGREERQADQNGLSD
jgi:phosphopantetheine adenylyltransferase